MSNPLNYQPSNSAVYYTPPSRINVPRTLIGCLIAAAAIVIGAVIYAKLQPLMNTIYVRVAQAVVGAVAVGTLAIIPVRFGKIRIPLVAAFIGAGLALLAAYVMWVTWVHDVIGHGIPLSYGTLIAHPIVLLRLIHLINNFGAWTWHHEAVRGFPLAIYWLAEFGLILACGVFLPLKAISDSEAVCTSCGAACKLVRPIARFADDRQADLIGAVEGRDFSALTSHEAPRWDTEPQLSARLLCCPRCGQTNVLAINHISWSSTQSGRKMNIRPVVNQLLVTHQEADQLKQLFRQIIEAREAAVAQTGPEQQNESPVENAPINGQGDSETRHEA
jgi:hypothetical protein